MNRLLSSILISALLCSMSTAAFAQDPGVAKKIAATPLTYPEAPMPSPDVLIPPPGENKYFPMRADGQPFVLNIDNTVNFTDALNRNTVDGRPRALDRSYFMTWPIVEQASRIMPSWRHYDQANLFYLWNGANKFFEKWTGYGP